MNKPTNRFAILMWVLAALVLVSEGVAEPYLHYLGNHAAPELQREPQHFISLMWVFATIRSGLRSSAQVAAVGVLIELVDQIRWNALRRA